MKVSLKQTFIKNSFWNFLTSITARVGGLIFTIIIARLLQPELFGIYSLVISVMFIINVFTDLGINAAIIRYLSDAFTKKDEKMAAGYYFYLFKIKIKLTLGFSALLLIVAYPISIYAFKKPELLMPLIICAVYMIFLSFIGFYEAVLYAVQKVKFVSLKEIMYQILRIALAVFGVYIFTNKVIGTLAGVMVAAVFAIIFLLIVVYKTSKFLSSTQEILTQIEKKRILNFIFYMTIGSITGVFFSYIDIVMLGMFVDSEYIGYYRAASGIVGAIIGLISIANLLLPLFVQLEGKKLESAFNKVLKYLSVFAFPASFGLVLVATPFINVIYGQSYLPAAIPIYLLSFLIIESVMSGVLSWLFAAKEKPETATKLLIIASIMNLVLNAVLILLFLKFSQMAAVVGAAAATLISRYFNLIMLAKKAKQELNVRIYSKNITKPLITAIIMAFFLMLFKGITNLYWPKSIIEFIIAAAIYFTILFLTKGITKEDFLLIKQIYFK